MESDIGHALDLDSLLQPRDPDESGSLSMRNAYGMKIAQEARDSLLESLRASSADTALPPAAAPSSRVSTVVPAAAPTAARPPQAAASPDWAMRTRPVSREELADALARRQNRSDARDRSVPFHQQAATWQDLKSSVQAFCRGAGIEMSSLSPEAQSMLPLIAGQLLREAVVGLNDLAQARTAGGIGPQARGALGSSNPLRSSTSVEQALQRLFESQGRLHGGPVESLRDVLQEAKDHETATLAAMRAAFHSFLGQLAPASVADQFEQGRARSLAPGQDPRSRYWDHYADFYRLLTQPGTANDLPHSFIETFGQEYARARARLRESRKPG
jgi:type VI secretion system FHA domain protein